MINAPGNLTPVFDILKATPFEPVLLIPVGLAGIGLLMIQGFFFGRSKWSPAAKAIFAWFYFLFAAAIAAVSLWSYYGDYLRLRQAVRAGGYETVEGCLEAFHAMSETGHATNGYALAEGPSPIPTSTLRQRSTARHSGMVRSIATVGSVSPLLAATSSAWKLPMEPALGR